MNSKIIHDAIDATFIELMAMSPEEFHKELALKGEGDIASILLYSGALKAREMEAMAYTSTIEGPAVQVSDSHDYRPEPGLNLSDIAESKSLQFCSANNEYAAHGSYPRENVSLLAESSATYTTLMSDELPWAA